MMPQSPATVKPWRDLYPVHPCADAFPMMSEAELEKLGQDFRDHGLQKPIVLWHPRDEGPYFVLDGRNRLEAFARLGTPIPSTPIGEASTLGGVSFFEHRFQMFEIVVDTNLDPATYVISANIRRRHLTKEQQAELIVRTIEAAKPIDRATPARSFNTKAGKKGGSTKDVVLAKAVTEAKKHGISKRTVQNARAKVQGKTPAPRKRIGLRSTPPTSEAVPLGTSRGSTTTSKVKISRTETSTPKDVIDQLQVLLRELRDRRRRNRDVLKDRSWNHKAISIAKQSAMLDFVETTLDRLVTNTRAREARRT